MHGHYDILLDFIEHYNLARGGGGFLYHILDPPVSLAYISDHVVEYSLVLSELPYKYNCALWSDMLRRWIGQHI